MSAELFRHYAFIISRQFLLNASNLSQVALIIKCKLLLFQSRNDAPKSPSPRLSVERIRVIGRGAMRPSI